MDEVILKAVTAIRTLSNWIMRLVPFAGLQVADRRDAGRTSHTAILSPAYSAALIAGVAEF